MTGQKFRHGDATLPTLPEDSSSFHVHVDVALQAIEESLVKREVRGLQLWKPEHKWALMSRLYRQSDGGRWENWERALPQGFASSWHTILTSSGQLELKFKWELGDSPPASWCLLPGEMESWWFVGHQKFLILMQVHIVRGEPSFDVYKVPGVTIKRPSIRTTFEVAQKEKVSGTSQLGDMTLVSGLFNEAQS